MQHTTPSIRRWLLTERIKDWVGTGVPYVVNGQEVVVAANGPEHQNWEAPARAKQPLAEPEGGVFPTFLIQVGGHQLRSISRRLLVAPLRTDNQRADLLLEDR